MKVSQVLTPQAPSIKQEYKSQILKGKCYNISRTFSVMIETESGNEFKIISLGIFERVRNALLKLVGIDYLNRSLHGKVSILSPDDLQSKISALSQQTISPQKTQSPATTVVSQTSMSSTPTFTATTPTTHTSATPTTPTAPTSSSTSSSTPTAATTAASTTSATQTSTSSAPTFTAATPTTTPTAATTAASTTLTPAASTSSATTAASTTPTAPTSTSTSSSTPTTPATTAASTTSATQTSTSSAPTFTAATPTTTPTSSSTSSTPTSTTTAAATTSAVSTPAITAAFGEDKLIQIFAHNSVGSFVNIKETLSNFEKNKSVETILAFIENSTEQERLYRNTEPTKFMVDVSYYGKRNNLDQSELKLLLTHMVLEGKISGFYQAKAGLDLFCLYKNPEDLPQNTPQPLFTQKKILEIDDYMTSMEASLPKLPNELNGKPITQEQEKIFETIKSDLMAEYHRRFVLNTKQVFAIAQDNGDITLNQPVFDYFVNQKAIHAWNIPTNRANAFFVKIKQDDDFGSSPIRWNLWRDEAVIQKEEQFKKENNIVITQDQLSTLTDANQQTLLILINDLNKRTQHGKYDWKPGTMSVTPILDLLKSKGFIDSFDRIGFGGHFHIYVKPEDKPLP